MEAPLNRTIQVLLTSAVRSYINEETRNLLANVTQKGSPQATNSSQVHLEAPLGYQLSANLSLSERLEAADQIDLEAQSQIEQTLEMADLERAIWVILFLSMVLVASSGNLIVVYIVSTNKEMKSVTNYFLVNLSVADTMVSMLNVTFNFVSMLMSNWPFGLIYCKISNFIAILSISASIFTLTAISCDRYNAILHPLRPRMSHRNALGWIALIWTISVILALPNAIYSQLVNAGSADQFATTCTMLWPDGRFPNSIYEFKYNIIIMVLTYIVPIITMAILYYQVGRELWGYQVIGEHVDLQQRALLAKKKIVKMMIVVVIIFALCWLPYQAFFIVNYYLPSLFQDAGVQYQRYYLIIYWLAMSNSMYNPIIIYFMNSKFRHEILKCLCFLFCCKKARRHSNAQQQQSLVPSPSLKLQHNRNGKSVASSTTITATTTTINGKSNGKPLTLANNSDNQLQQLEQNASLVGNKLDRFDSRAGLHRRHSDWDKQKETSTSKRPLINTPSKFQHEAKVRPDICESQPFLETSDSATTIKTNKPNESLTSGSISQIEASSTNSNANCIDLSWI